MTGRADKNLKAELGIIFDCLGGTEKKVRKSRHFAKKLHQCLYFYKKARKSRHFAKKTHKCCQKVPGQISARELKSQVPAHFAGLQAMPECSHGFDTMSSP